MTIAIHQPNYLPWPGYFLKMASCDTFVFLDHVKYTKSGYTRRTKIQHNNGSDQWLTVPLAKHSDFSPIKELQVAHIHWAQKHQSLLYERYHRLPFYHECMDVMHPLIQNIKFGKSLCHVNMQIILEIKDILGLSCNTLVSSNLPLDNTYADVNMDICKAIGASEYISGKGGDKYQNGEVYLSKGIELKILDSKQVLEERIKDKSLHGFISRSIVELWSHVGIEQLRIWMHQVKGLKSD